MTNRKITRTTDADFAFVIAATGQSLSGFPISRVIIIMIYNKVNISSTCSACCVEEAP